MAAKARPSRPVVPGDACAALVRIHAGTSPLVTMHQGKTITPPPHVDTGDGRVLKVLHRVLQIQADASPYCSLHPPGPMTDDFPVSSANGRQ